MGKSAILLGATGVTGSHLLNYILQDDDYSKVTVFGRNALPFKHPKLEQNIIDLLKLENVKVHFKADVVFCCIGTTKAKTPDKDLYKAIDYGIPVAAAKLCKENKISCFVVMSSLGANKNSNVFYTKTKGEMEVAVLEQKLPQTYILQPSVIAGNRKEKRIGESFVKGVMKLVNPILIGRFEKYRSIHAKTIAKAMINLPKGNRPSGIIPSHIIKEISQHGS